MSPVDAAESDIQDWFERHRQWSDGTALAYWHALKAWFSWLQMQGHRSDHPMLLLLPPPRQPSVPRPLSDEDLRRLIGERMHDRTRLMILLAAFAGLRASEIARVRGEDVDLSARLLYVKGKGGARKTVPLHPVLVRAAARMPKNGWWFPGRRLDGYVDEGRPVLASSVSQTISNAMTRAGVRGTPHALRHWFGTSTLRKCGDLRTVQTLMRHDSSRSTEIYTEVADDRRGEVVDMLNPWGSSSFPGLPSQDL
ncbi:tyrosine-type recombinase/integrase [Mycolicibacterium sphagni]|uniref:tyrosine-type recombinase/integrase n=1 Tax=Mycolicibacterium sphagni TaxID=1786 RepID=UPI0021F2ED64|nr:site-specific integrase [Mycolicibacterium sphagni]